MAMLEPDVTKRITIVEAIRRLTQAESEEVDVTDINAVSKESNANPKVGTAPPKKRKRVASEATQNRKVRPKVTGAESV